VTRAASGVLTDFHLSPSLPLEQRSQITQALSGVIPVLEDCNRVEKTVIQKIESLLGQTVGMISRGPSTEDVEILNSFPA
jgi:hypothetical protein